MTTTTGFGRRGAADKIDTVMHRAGFGEVPAPTRARTAAAADPVGIETSLEAHDVGVEAILGRVPVLTVGIILLLTAIFLLQKQVAFDLGEHGRMSYESLLALGAASRDLVFGQGQIWRIVTAPMLHSDSHHLLGNAFALLMVGVGLEVVIGRGWYAAIYVAAAFTGEIASLASNPGHIVGVGASGAITGVVGAAFVMSFSWRADEELRRKMRRAALFFGVPAILPLAFGASGGTDYWAHFGGAVGGGLVALALMTVWSGGRLRPPGAELAGRLAAASLVLPVVAALFAALQFDTHAARAAEMIPQKQMPTRIEDMVTRAADLTVRYPKDPRAHLLLGVGHLYGSRLSAAEFEFRIVLAKTPDDPTSVFRPSRIFAQAFLAIAVASQNRLVEARQIAGPVCKAKDAGPGGLVLQAAKLCG